jgi:hypothetical protein
MDNKGALKGSSGQIRLASDWYSGKRAWYKRPPLYAFNFDLEFFKGVQSSLLLRTKFPLILLFFGRWSVCAQTGLFSDKPVSKKASTVHFMFGGRFGDSQTVQKTACAAL